jgi:cytochrome o ubiquinol oxidase subunit II
MNSPKFLIGLLAVIATLLALIFILRSEYALVMHPKGIIAQQMLDLIFTNYLLMFIVIVPTFFVLFAIAWKYRTKNAKAQYDPEHTSSVFSELFLWLIPIPPIAVMIGITWKATHELDPYRPLVSEVAPLTIQVVAINWKWLFLYPEQKIATLNFFQIPVGTPIHLKLAADNSPMNSFWVPQLSGQIYAMTGMITPLHFIADEAGEYAGRAAEINGEGYAAMTFIAKASSQSDFVEWIKQVQQSPLKLTDDIYNELIQPTQKLPVTYYSTFEEGLFKKIVMKYMHPTSVPRWKT